MENCITNQWQLIEEMYSVSKATRKVLRHASQVTTSQTRKDRLVQVPTNRALQAQHELKRVEAAIAKYDEYYPQQRPKTK